MNDRSTLHHQIDRLLDAYIGAIPMLSQRMVLFEITKSASFCARFKAGEGMTSDTYDKIVRWLDERWPQRTPWPEDVPRPQRAAS